MQVKVHYLGQLQRAAKASAETVEIDAPYTLADLVRMLGERHDNVFRTMIEHRSTLFFVNDTDVAPTQPLHDGDDVAILAPVAGGAT
jgi:molybdopterin converting factor small subunit